MPDAHGRFLKGEHWRPVQVFRNKEWLEQEYITRGRSAGEIASEFGVTDAAIFHWLRRHGIPRRDIATTRALKYWGASREANPMYGKRGAQVPNWKGGITPERQAFYASLEWKDAAESVRLIDGDRCRRCGRAPRGHKAIAIHHIVSIRVKALRSDLNNLVLLCSACHRWVHSPMNTDGEYIGKGGALR